MMGIFSRSICMEQGLSKGSMLPYIHRARAAGYAVMVLRPNTNSVCVEGRKFPITGSESPEFHAMYAWENIISKADNVQQIAFLSYGNGASLVKDLIVRQMVRTKEDEAEVNRITAFVAIEASHIIEVDDAQDLKLLLKNISVNMESCSVPRGYRLNYRRDRVGVLTLSLGLPAGTTELQNVAVSIASALEPSFRFLDMAFRGAANLAVSFSAAVAVAEGHDAAKAETNSNTRAELEPEEPPVQLTQEEPASPPPKQGFFQILFGGKPDAASPAQKSGGRKKNADNVNIGDEDEKLQVTDFDLLKIIGIGAFGKVMLVRKKNGSASGGVYAMKVLKKSVVAAKGQIEHTKSERSILCEIRHPYIVRLRFAFQSADKLYLVTDYYNGGSLFFHLRKSRSFSEERAKFYSAQLLSALNHLHQQHIIYRDLKLENVLMDHQGHIALTDFGLSKQNIDLSGGATTFCGTAEYIAPELLKGQKYGSAVDWWSFGILLYEMMHGRTPFYDKNRKLMFYRIINTAPSFPPNFSPEACDCIRGLLTVSETERMGSSTAGARDIMQSAFFSTIDFDALFRRELNPPFKPGVVNELDTKYISKTYLQSEARDSPPKRGEVHHQFEAFTFSGDSAMTGDDK